VIAGSVDAALTTNQIRIPEHVPHLLGCLLLPSLDENINEDNYELIMCERFGVVFY